MSVNDQQTETKQNVESHGSKFPELPGDILIVHNRELYVGNGSQWMNVGFRSHNCETSNKSGYTDEDAAVFQRFFPGYTLGAEVAVARVDHPFTDMVVRKGLVVKDHWVACNKNKDIFVSADGFIWCPRTEYGEGASRKETEWLQNRIILVEAVAEWRSKVTSTNISDSDFTQQGHEAIVKTVAYSIIDYLECGTSPKKAIKLVRKEVLRGMGDYTPGIYKWVDTFLDITLVFPNNN